MSKGNNFDNFGMSNKNKKKKSNYWVFFIEMPYLKIIITREEGARFKFGGVQLSDLLARISIDPEEDITLNIFVRNVGSHVNDVSQLQLSEVLDFFLTKNSAKKNDKTGVIDDPLGQTHSFASRENLFSLEICYFVLFWKVGTDIWTDDMCENNDHYRPWLWAGLVDQQW